VVGHRYGTYRSGFDTKSGDEGSVDPNTIRLKTNFLQSNGRLFYERTSNAFPLIYLTKILPFMFIYRHPYLISIHSKFAKNGILKKRMNSITALDQPFGTKLWNIWMLSFPELQKCLFFYKLAKASIDFVSSSYGINLF
jgi:hypothetical protein